MGADMKGNSRTVKKMGRVFSTRKMEAGKKENTWMEKGMGRLFFTILMEG